MPVWTFVFEYCPTPSRIISWTNSSPSWLVREAQPYTSSCCVFCPCWVSVASGFCTSERNSKSIISLSVPSVWAVDLSTLNAECWKRKRQHLSGVGDKSGRRGCLSPLLPFPPLVPREGPCGLSTSAGHGCYFIWVLSLFFSNIQFKDLLVRLLNLSYPQVPGFLRPPHLTGAHYSRKQLSTQDTDLPLSTVYVANCGISTATFGFRKHGLCWQFFGLFCQNVTAFGILHF